MDSAVSLIVSEQISKFHSFIVDLTLNNKAEFSQFQNSPTCPSDRNFEYQNV